MEKPSLNERIAAANEARLKMQRTQARYRAGQATYEELAASAKTFCAAFDEYHLAKFGRRKKPDWRAVIR
jgi:hypothetical protein